MDQKPLAPVAPSAVALHEDAGVAALMLALPVLLPSAMPPVLGAGSLLGGLSIGGEAEGDGPIGLADRTPWLAMAVAPQQPAPRVGAEMIEGGKERRPQAVARRVRPGLREARAGAECSPGVCVCGHCDLTARRP